MAVDRALLDATLDVIRQSLQADGGDVALCPLSSLDMSEGIERILREHVPGVTRVQPAAF